MRTYLISFLIGTAAVLVVLVIGLLALGLAAQADDWKSFEIAIGPIRLFEFEREGTTTTTSMGVGVVLVSALAGLANAGAAAVLRRRARSI